jgi:predicted P-loop ATPase
MFKHIQDYNLKGWATFPTHNKIPPEGYSWKRSEPAAFVDEKTYDTGEYAVVLRPVDLVIDIDPRNFPANTNVWKAFKTTYGLEGIEEKTLVVRTGGGGYHIYLTKPENVFVRKHIKEWPGIDFISGDKGAYVLGPGSKHSSGGIYKVLRGEIGLVKEAPTALLAVIEKSKSEINEDGEKKKIEYSDDAQNITRYKEYLIDYAPPAVEGQSGDQTTFKIACRGRDFSLSPQKTLELMLEHYNTKCTPPWNPDDLAKKVLNAYKYSEDTPGKKDPKAVFDHVGEANNLYDSWNDEWALKKNGTPMPVLMNAVKYLTLWSEISSCVRFNEIAYDVEVVGKLPWHGRRAGKYWSDEDTVHLKYYFSTKVKTEFQIQCLLEAIYIVAARKQFHPVREYLKSLKWDGIKRLDEWLTTYCKVEKTEYSTTVGRKTLVAAVGRIFNPGCKFDHVLVLEGAQAIGKSFTCAILGGEWYGDFNVDPTNKDTVDAMRGKWFIELPEMSVVRKRQDIEALKAFITRTEDRVRFAYARKTKDLPRQSIFVGTVNPDNVGYLVDSTGNRRFWPVLCTQKIDTDGIKRDRDQIFAEACAVYQGGEPLHLVGERLQGEAEAEAQDRVEQDPWVEIIGQWSDNAEFDEVNTTVIYEQVLNGVKKNITRVDQIRIGKALTIAGWSKKRVSTGYMYSREPRVHFLGLTGK